MNADNKHEDFVSLRTAQLLKEKGFDWDCGQVYGLTKKTKSVKGKIYFNFDNVNPNASPDLCSAPTLGMALKWLREKHDICIYCYNAAKRDKHYGAWEAAGSWIKDDVSVIFHSSHSVFADSYETAVEVALFICLTDYVNAK